MQLYDWLYIAVKAILHETPCVQQWSYDKRAACPSTLPKNPPRLQSTVVQIAYPFLNTLRVHVHYTRAYSVTGVGHLKVRGGFQPQEFKPIEQYHTLWQE